MKNSLIILGFAVAFLPACYVQVEENQFCKTAQMDFLGVPALASLDQEKSFELNISPALKSVDSYEHVETQTRVSPVEANLQAISTGEIGGGLGFLESIVITVQSLSGGDEVIVAEYFKTEATTLQKIDLDVYSDINLYEIAAQGPMKVTVHLSSSPGLAPELGWSLATRVCVETEGKAISSE